MCGDASALAFAKDSSRFFFQIPFIFSIFFFGLLIEHFEEGALSPSFSLDRNHTKTNNIKNSLFFSFITSFSSFLPHKQRTKKKEERNLYYAIFGSSRFATSFEY